MNPDSPHHVLLVEDSEADVFLLKTAIDLEALPLQLSAVHDGVEALEFLARNDPPELVLLDLNMPRMNGFEVLDSLRNRDPSFPIVVLTTSRASQDRVRAEELGADAFIVKPQGFEEMTTLLQGILERLKRRAPWETLTSGT